MPVDNYKEKAETAQIVDDLLRDLIILRKNILHCGFPDSWRLMIKETDLISTKLDQLASRMSIHADNLEKGK